MRQMGKVIRQTTKKPALIFDIDGTLALHNGRGPYDYQQCVTDLLYEAVGDVLTRYWYAGYAILLVSGREETCRMQTERWLKKHNVSYELLLMRPQGDYRKDVIIKEEMYRREIEPSYDILFVLDDRSSVVKMWRHTLGLTCFQVADGDF